MSTSVTETADKPATPIRPTVKPPVKPSGKALPIHNTYHRKRKLIQLICFLIFLALPFFNVMRFHIPRQRFYFAGYELWINEFAIIFFSLLFLLYVIAAASMLYGRVYCGYLCPQMIFSEASLKLEERLSKFVNKRFIKLPATKRQWISRALFYAVLAAASVFLAFVFISYFVEPRDLVRRLLSFDIQTAGGISGAATTLLTFLDFAFVRQGFCKTICPYGYLQGMLGDNETLVVQYRDGDGKSAKKDCIECKKCVRVCHMGIDIRKTPYQMECIHCGECVDACKLIMGKFGKDTLIHYAWGEKGELLGEKAKWYRRLGLRDAKRVAVFAIIVIYATVLATVFSLRHNVLVRVMPDRSTLYRVGDDGRIYNTFRLILANRGGKEATVQLALNGLPDAKIELENNDMSLAAGESSEQRFEISVPAGKLAEQVNHFEITGTVSPDATTNQFAETFIVPVEKK